MSRSQHSRALIFLTTFGFAAFAWGGCALVLGIEKRTEGEAEATGPVDAETEIETSDLCIEYCDAVMSNCEEEHAQYAARASCINSCNALPPGLSSEPLGNTIECRLRRANSAEGRPEEFCLAAGPGGGNSCGTKCEAWCHMLESECPSDYALLDDCMSSCDTIEDDGTFDVENSYQNDDLTCRLIHLGAAADDPIHCDHGSYVPTSQCNAPAEGEPDCDRYCDILMGNCTDEHAVYESRGDCMAACAVFPLGDLSHRTENTVGCRTYHAVSAAEDPVHCDHAGPTGDGHCGANPEDDQTGNCDSHCLLFEEGCPTEFSADFDSVDECSRQCAVDFDGNGAENDVFYEVETAVDEDNLECRTFYAVKAVAGDESACGKAALSSTCD